MRMTLEGLDGNAFNLLGHFQRAARKQGWPQRDVEAVLAEARSGTYEHLLQTLLKYTEPPECQAQCQV